jgi:SAM-dependent methyltransferase
LATGRVLEVGMGSGLNLPFYDRSHVECVWGIEPSSGMRRKAAAAVEATDLRVQLLDVPAEGIPLGDDSIDSIVLTYTLCSIADWRTALEQMRRVLKPGGQVVFAEHGLAPDVAIQRRQHRLDPIWTRAAGGCHLDRPIVACLEETGFEIERVDADYRGVPKSATYTSWGVATIASQARPNARG